MSAICKPLKIMSSHFPTPSSLKKAPNSACQMKSQPIAWHFIFRVPLGDRFQTPRTPKKQKKQEYLKKQALK